MLHTASNLQPLQSRNSRSAARTQLNPNGEAVHGREDRDSVRAMATANLDAWLAQITQCRPLTEPQMRVLCDIVKSQLLEESNVQPVSSPVTVVGDIHGQFWDVLELFRIAGECPTTSYVFMVSPASLAASLE